MDDYNEFFKEKPRLSEVEIDTELPVEERQKKRKGRRTSRRRRFMISFLIVVLLIGSSAGIYYAHTHDLLNVEKIEVSGNDHYSVMEVVEMAKAETGERILTLDTKPMKNALLKQPYIKTVKITKLLPHRLKITVVEREEAYAASLAGSYIILDEEQYALRKSNESGGYIVIEGFVPKEVVIGEPYEVENQVFFDDVVDVAKLMNDYGIEAKKITFDEGMIKTYFTDKLVCIASSENYKKYIDQIYEILEKNHELGIERGTIHVGDNAYFAFSPVIE